MKYQVIRNEHDIYSMAPLPLVMKHYAFQHIDFSRSDVISQQVQYDDCLFLGCNIPELMFSNIRNNCAVFPNLHLPYNLFPNTLYSSDTLYDGFDLMHPETFQSCFDQVVYQHYLRIGKRTDDIKESLARSLHDQSITNTMYDFLETFDEKRIVGIMGGHGMSRTDAIYRKIVMISKRLTEQGCLMISGGGPGAMEATHLGAWMAGYSDVDVTRVLNILSSAPRFVDADWLATAFNVIRNYPQTSHVSLSIPTWLYGHEPSTPFATHIAKYFENSIRENEILSIAKGGVIYTPGSAGTMQEVFQDAAQNHYLSVEYASPMIFLGVKYWTQTMPVYTLLEKLVEDGQYKNLLLCLTDDEQRVMDALSDFSYQASLDVN